MIQLLSQGHYALFAIIVIALVISLSFHEFGHALLAKLFGDDTAERAGRLTLNPFAHVDAFGLMMVVLVGFGYAKPVPTDPRNFRSRWASLWVSAAGPLTNLLLAIVALNFFTFAVGAGWDYFAGAGPVGNWDGHGVPSPPIQARRYFNQWRLREPCNQAAKGTRSAEAGRR